MRGNNQFQKIKIKARTRIKHEQTSQLHHIINKNLRLQHALKPPSHPTNKNPQHFTKFQKIQPI
jgi:hypothetical protein